MLPCASVTLVLSGCLTIDSQEDFCEPVSIILLWTFSFFFLVWISHAEVIEFIFCIWPSCNHWHLQRVDVLLSYRSLTHFFSHKTRTGSCSSTCLKTLLSVFLLLLFNAEPSVLETRFKQTWLPFAIRYPIYQGNFMPFTQEKHGICFSQKEWC